MKKLLIILLLGSSLPIWAMECPPDKPLKDKQGNCHDCSISSYFPTENVEEAECNKCPYREFINGKCLPKCDESSFRTYNREGLPESYCTSCFNVFDKLMTSKEECNRCSNREYIDGGCYKKCDEDTFRNSDKECLRCSVIDINGNLDGGYVYNISFSIMDGEWDYSNPHTELVKLNLEASLEECTKCPNRKYVNGKCILEKSS